MTIRFFGLLCLFCLQGLEQKDQFNSTEYTTELKKFYDNVNTLSADFNQEKQSILFDEPLLSSGFFAYQKENKIRWEQKSPTSNYFIINGEETIQFDGEKISKNKGINIQIIFFKKFIFSTLNGSFLTDKSFDKKITKQKEGVEIKLTPMDKRIKKRIQSINLLFHESSYLLQEITLNENDSESTKITFSDTKFNTDLAPSTFTK